MNKPTNFFNELIKMWVKNGCTYHSSTTEKPPTCATQKYNNYRSMIFIKHIIAFPWLTPCLEIGKLKCKPKFSSLKLEKWARVVFYNFMKLNIHFATWSWSLVVCSFGEVNISQHFTCDVHRPFGICYGTFVYCHKSFFE